MKRKRLTRGKADVKNTSSFKSISNVFKIE